MLRVPGGSLYYEVRGHGPTLLMIPGGGGDAGFFTGVAERLASRFRVVTYDRRGNSRSVMDEPVGYSIATQVDDAVRLLGPVSKPHAARAEPKHRLPAPVDNPP